MEQLESRRVVEEEEKDYGQADVDDVDVIAPTPSEIGVLNKLSGYTQLADVHQEWLTSTHR